MEPTTTRRRSLAFLYMVIFLCRVPALLFRVCGFWGSSLPPPPARHRDFPMGPSQGNRPGGGGKSQTQDPPPGDFTSRVEVKTKPKTSNRAGVEVGACPPPLGAEHRDARAHGGGFFFSPVPVASAARGPEGGPRGRRRRSFSPARAFFRPLAPTRRRREAPLAPVC